MRGNLPDGDSNLIRNFLHQISIILVPDAADTVLPKNHRTIRFLMVDGRVTEDMNIFCFGQTGGAASSIPDASRPARNVSGMAQFYGERQSAVICLAADNAAVRGKERAIARAAEASVAFGSISSRMVRTM